MEIKKEIFKAYDIRGIYPGEVNEDAASELGRAFSEIYIEDKVLIGHDARTSSEALAEELMSSIEECGFNPVYIGLVSSDEFYVSCLSKELPGIMVTASHNPPEYNGFKMLSAEGNSVGKGSGMEELQKKMMSKQYSLPKRDRGNRSRMETGPDFINTLLKCVPSDTVGPLSVVIDAGNGALGPCLQRLIPKYENLKVKELFWSPDGTFPNRSPDPLKESAQDRLIEEVLKNPGHFGVSFDGDGDRVFVVDEEGEPVPSDFLGAMLTHYFLSLDPEASVVRDVTVSQVLSETVSEHEKARIVTERVGHSFIKRTMKETGAVLGVEKSGHFYFKDMYRADSGVLAMLYLLKYLSEKKQSLKEAVDPLRKKYFLTGQINLSVKEDPAEILDRVSESYRNESTDRIDGLSVTSDRWRFVIRSSNTEPVVRLVAEAKSKEDLKAKVDEVIEVIEPISVSGYSI